MVSIISILGDIKSGIRKNDLKLLNYYHEVPVLYPAAIDMVDKEIVEITMHGVHAAVLALQKQTFLKSSSFPDGLCVHSFLEYINVRNCMAVLGRFAYVNVNAERRNAVRVKVDSDVDIIYSSSGHSFAGRLHDISVSGLSFFAQGLLPVGIGDEGTISIRLSGRELHIPSMFLKTDKKDEGYIHAFSILPDSKTEILVSQFIYARQVDIIREIKEQIV